MSNSKLEYEGFSHLPFQVRMLRRDKTSERAFNTFCKSNNIKAMKFGIDGTEAYKPYHIDTTLRAAPDKFCLLPSGGYILTELKGCSNRGVFIKCASLAKYVEWNKLFNVFAFIYNSVTRMYAYMPMAELAVIAENAGKSIHTNMGEVFHIPCDMLEWTNLPIIHEPAYADNYQK